MPTNYKVLGQAAPASASLTALYTVPSATEAVLSTMTICNRGATTGNVRMAVRPNGASIANQHYFVYDAAVAPNDSLFLTVGATMDAADVLDVYASTASFSFHAYGSEIS